MPKQIKRIWNNGNSTLERLLKENKNGSFLEFIKSKATQLRFNKSINNYTFEFDGDIISVKKLINDDKRLHTFKQFLLYLNGTNGLPNITHFREIYDSDGNFLILEYPKIKGQSLGDALDNGIKSVDEIKQFLMVLLRASEIVKIMHSKGFAHNDLKPDNVLYSSKKVSLLDLDSFDKIDSSRCPEFYTFGYSAPELFKESSIDDKADIFSLGATAYEIIYGRHIFENLPISSKETKDFNIPNMSRTKRKDIIYHLKINAYLNLLRTRGFFCDPPINVPYELRRLVTDCTAYDSSFRPNINEFVTSLEKIIDAWN